MEHPPLELFTLIGCGVLFAIGEALFPARRRRYLPYLLMDVLVFIGLVLLRVPLRQLFVWPLDALGVNQLPAVIWAQGLPSVPKIIVGILLVDICLYVMHRAMHSNARLWQVHEFHHTIEQLNWFSGFRNSLPQTTAFAIPQALLGYVLLDFSSLEAGVAFSIGILFQLLTHANFDLPVGPLKYVIVTPQFHRIHHATDPKLGDKNIAVFFSFLDLIFGTFIDPDKAPEYEVGLGAPYRPILSFLGLGRVRQKLEAIVGTAGTNTEDEATAFQFRG